MTTPPWTKGSSSYPVLAVVRRRIKERAFSYGEGRLGGRGQCSLNGRQIAHADLRRCQPNCLPTLERHANKILRMSITPGILLGRASEVLSFVYRLLRLHHLTPQLALQCKCVVSSFGGKSACEVRSLSSPSRQRPFASALEFRSLLNARCDLDLDATRTTTLMCPLSAAETCCMVDVVSTACLAAQSQIHRSYLRGQTFLKEREMSWA